MYDGPDPCARRSICSQPSAGPFSAGCISLPQHTALGRNFQVIYEQANAHGQKVQAAGANMAQTDSAVGSSWAKFQICRWRG
ncbi:hypothetical protein B1T48_28425 [Mycobacterium persicum]|nr:hypothetical protein B1T48_28425 [Mycobacterium persicum]